MTLNDVFHRVAKARLPLFVKGPLLLASAWVFQGILYMDKSERLFRLTLLLVGSVALSWWMTPILGIWPASATAFLGTHSINFVFNGQFWVVVKNTGLLRTPVERFHEWELRLSRLPSVCPAISRVVIYGSRARGGGTTSGDLDVRLVRRCGFSSAIIACSLVMALRTRALVSKFPLDIYVADTETSLERLDEAGYTL